MVARYGDEEELVHRIEAKYLDDNSGSQPQPRLADGEEQHEASEPEPEGGEAGAAEPGGQLVVRAALVEGEAVHGPVSCRRSLLQSLSAFASHRPDIGSAAIGEPPNRLQTTGYRWAASLRATGCCGAQRAVGRCAKRSCSCSGPTHPRTTR